MIVTLAIGTALLALGIALGPELLLAQPRRLPATRAAAAVCLPDLDSIEHRLEELAEHIGAVHSLAEDRRHRIARLQDGYDFAVTCSFARGVIETIDLLRDFRSRLEHPGWTLLLGDSRQCVVRPARVAVYAPPDTHNEGPSS